MNKKIFGISLALLVLSMSSIMAQSKIALSIVSNEGGAKVLLNGKLLGYATPNFSILLPVRTGNVTVRVEKDGFVPFSQVVSIGTAPVTLNVTLVRVGGTAVLPPPTQMQSTFTLSANSSPAGADVYLNGVLQGKSPITLSVQAGNYTVNFKLPNYLETTQNVQVSGNSSVNVALQAQTYPLQVQSNPSGADVYLNGQLSGKAPLNLSLMPGNYTVTLRMGNYNDFTQNVSVPGQSMVSGTLIQALVPFSIRNLFPGAEILVDGISMGKTSAREITLQIAPGVHSLTIRVNGFLDLNTTITVTSGMQPFTPTLTQMPAKYTVVIPANLQNPDAKNNPQNQVQLFIDGQYKPGFIGTIDPGKHTVKMVSGAIQFELTQDFLAGKDYIFEPFGGLNIR